jgi:hypothetical protein
MTGVAEYLKDVKSYKTKSVIFGDGGKGEILGIGKLINNNLPKLENVLLVEGLTTNLISINQLCDQGLTVNFTKSECYAWVSQESDYNSPRSSNIKDESEKQTRMQHHKLPRLASPKTLMQHHNELIESIKVAINSLRLGGWKDVERDDAASSSQMKPHFGSLIEPRSVKEALKNEYWIKAMQEELNQLKRSEVWILVPGP